MRPGVLVIGLCVLGIHGSLWAQADHFSQAQLIMRSTCREDATPAAVTEQTHTTLVSQSDVSVRGRKVGWRAVVKTNGANSFRVQRLAPGDRFRGAHLEWWVNDTPRLSLSVGTDCSVQTARRMLLDEAGQPRAVVHLDEELNDTDTRDQLNPPVPVGKSTTGIKVAMVDAGINYTLPSIVERLARNEQGEILGFDFWDQDRRPFDANPVRSPFFPQRHGTRTASLLLREAPDAVLVPYRYPRPDMSRMAQLLQAVERHKIRIVGLPLGGHKRSEWEIFAASARGMKTTLFIVSAGNTGESIDFRPVFPASLGLDNMIVVTSADDSGQPAAGSNWGRNSVDLLIAAENRNAIDFDGKETKVSGSSYAVSRVAALAARLLVQNPTWDAARLKKAILTRAIKEGFGQFVSVGYLPDPMAERSEVRLVRTDTIEPDPAGRKGGLALDVHIALLVNSGWRESDIPALIEKLRETLGQCQIHLLKVRQHTFSVSPRLLDFDAATSHTLVTQANLPTPAVYLVRDTLRRPAYEGEAFGHSNAKYRSWLRDTVWLTAGIRDADVALAHELFHVLTDSGAHAREAGNLMQEQTYPGDEQLSKLQCQQARQTALAKGLIKP